MPNSCKSNRLRSVLASRQPFSMGESKFHWENIRGRMTLFATCATNSWDGETRIGDSSVIASWHGDHDSARALAAVIFKNRKFYRHQITEAKENALLTRAAKKW